MINFTWAFQQNDNSHHEMDLCFPQKFKFLDICIMFIPLLISDAQKMILNNPLSYLSDMPLRISLEKYEAESYHWVLSKD